MLLISFLSVGILLGLLLYGINVATYSTSRDYNSSSLLMRTYECGYIAIPNQSRYQHSIAYYVVALLYVIFDLEIALLLPAIVSLFYIGNTGIILLLLVMTLLCLCFVYELSLGIFTNLSFYPYKGN